MFGIQRLYLMLAGAAVAIGLSFSAGYEWRDRSADNELLVKQAEIDAMLLEAQARATVASEDARQLEQLARVREALAGEVEALRNQERAVVERVVTKEVIKYVENNYSGSIVMPGEWVRIHDIAAAGRSPGMSAAPYATGAAYDDAVRVTDAGAIAITAENYSTCNEIRDQLVSLQDWVRAALPPPL
jgi:hypothetical protein